MPSVPLKTYSTHLYYFGLIILVSGLPASKFLMSISQLIIGTAWLMQGDYKERISSFFKNKLALLLTSVFFIHLLGLLYTSDLDYGLEDIRKKIPLFILPFLFSTLPALSKKQVETILLVFVSAVLFSTLISLFIYLEIYKRPYRDIREISIFISHIRLSLMICLSIFILASRIKSQTLTWIKILFLLVISWLVYFLFLIESLTGIGILLFLLVATLAYNLTNIKNRIGKAVFSLVILSYLASLFFYIRDIYLDFKPKENYSLSSIQKKTSKGNAYHHDFSSGTLENGYYVRLFISPVELEEEWSKRSTMDLHGKDNKEQYLKETLIRFLSSKGLKKDAEGVRKLSVQEIKAIENGIANVHYIRRNSLRARLHAIVWELGNYQAGGNPSGHSLTMRFEFWKTAWAVIRDQPITGVGTGDTKIALAEKYRETNSLLDEKHRLRAHNQFLSIGIAFGIPVMLYFIFTLFYPIILNKKHTLYLVFSLIAIISMFSEDTLETQAGVTFYAFFNAFFLFSGKKP